MSDKSKIEWTDATWNPVTGCTKVSEGCRNCYAERIINRFYGKGEFDRIVLHDERLEIPQRARKPKMYFVNSVSDLFHDAVPENFIHQVFQEMVITPQHTFQILTKRPKRMKAFFDKCGGRKNIWIGVSVEDQKTADERIPILLATPACIRWISVEPMLEKINLDKLQFNLLHLDWIVVGGESGPHKRFFDPNWARSIRDYCKSWKIPFFMKQIDKIQPIPDDLMVREYPILKD